MVELLREDFTSYVALLSGLAEFRTETARWRLVDDVLTGSPREHDIRGLLDLSGSPRSAAVSLLTSLLRFGQVEPGRELIGILANKLLGAYIFDPEPEAFLRGLFARYPLNQAVAPSAPVTDWKGSDDPASVQEKIIGENTLRDVRMLELALEAARSVVLIRTPTSLGSGFLCGPDVVMTNHHVIGEVTTATQCSFAFFFELDRQLQAKPTQTARMLPGGLFFTDPVLDVTLVQVADVPGDVAPLVLKRLRLERSARVNIIQHPGGHYKKISMQNNFVEYADGSVLQYTTSTEPGSSGSPVFNEAFEVVAVHHSGGTLVEPSTQRRYLRNAGSAMIAVLSAVQQHAPDLYAKLSLA